MKSSTKSPDYLAVEAFLRRSPDQLSGKTPDEIGALAIAAGYNRSAVAEFVSQLTLVGWRPMNRRTGGAS